MRTRSGIIGVVLLSLLAACASSGDADELSEEEQQYVDAWSAVFQSDEEGFGVEPADADCMATELMAELGTEPFDEADVAADDIEPEDSIGALLGDGVIEDEQADTIIDAWSDCVDLAEVLGQSVADEFDLGEETATCVAEGSGEDDMLSELLRPVLTMESGEPDEEVQRAFTELLTECGAMTATIANELSSGGTITEEQAQCVAEAVVEDLGPAGVAALGTEAATEADEQAANEAFATAAEDCGLDPSLFGG